MGVVPQGLRAITEVLGALFGDHEDDEVRCWVTSDLTVVTLRFVDSRGTNAWPNPVPVTRKFSWQGKRDTRDTRAY